MWNIYLRGSANGKKIDKALRCASGHLSRSSSSRKVRQRLSLVWAMPSHGIAVSNIDGSRLA